MASCGSWWWQPPSSGERLARCWTWCAAIILPCCLHMLQDWYSLVRRWLPEGGWCQPGLRLGLTHTAKLAARTILTLRLPIQNWQQNLSFRTYCYPNRNGYPYITFGKTKPHFWGKKVSGQYSGTETETIPHSPLLIRDQWSSSSSDKYLYDHLPYQRDECNSLIGGCGHLSETWRHVSESNLIVHTVHTVHIIQILLHTLYTAH